MRAAVAVAALSLSLALAFAGACSPSPVTEKEARTFTALALRDAGLVGVRVRSEVSTCEVGSRSGWRTTADTARGPVELCVSRSELRAMSVQDGGPDGQPLLDDDAFGRLDRYRGPVPGRRFVPTVMGAGALLGVVASITVYVWREEHAQPGPG